MNLIHCRAVFPHAQERWAVSEPPLPHSLRGTGVNHRFHEWEEWRGEGDKELVAKALKQGKHFVNNFYIIYDGLTFWFCCFEWNAKKKVLVSTKVLSDILFICPFFVKCLATFPGCRKGTVLNHAACEPCIRAGMKCSAGDCQSRKDRSDRSIWPLNFWGELELGYTLPLTQCR